MTGAMGPTQTLVDVTERLERARRAARDHAPDNPSAQLEHFHGAVRELARDLLQPRILTTKNWYVRIRMKGTEERGEWHNVTAETKDQARTAAIQHWILYDVMEVRDLSSIGSP